MQKTDKTYKVLDELCEFTLDKEFKNNIKNSLDDATLRVLLSTVDALRKEGYMQGRAGIAYSKIGR